MKYRLNAECSEDVASFIEELHQELKSFSFRRIEGLQGVEFEFESDYWPDIDSLIFDIQNITDSTAMYKTVKPVDNSKTLLCSRGRITACNLNSIKMVRAKFKCVEKTQMESGEKIKLHPVTGGSPENENFFKWTPFGQIEIGILNENASKEFEVGQEYLVDFTKAN
jgi:hypothetical protein